MAHPPSGIGPYGQVPSAPRRRSKHPGVTARIAAIARELAELNTPKSPASLGGWVWSSCSRAVWWPTARGPPCCSRALTSVVMMRAPLAPSGWPIAIAPPLTLVLAEVFNILRDWYNNRAGRGDPKAMDKFERGEKVIEGQKRIAVPRRQRSITRKVDGR